MMTTNLKTSVLTNQHLDYILELELKDKLYYDEDIEREIVKFYAWTKKDFKDYLTKKSVRGQIAIAEKDNIHTITGFIIYDINEKKKNIEIINLVGADEETIEFLIKYIINKARFATKPHSVSYHIRYDNVKNLKVLKHITENEKIKPGIVEEYFEDKSDAIVYDFPFTK